MLMHELYTSFRNDFLDGQDLARMRITLAKKACRTYSEDVEYMRKRNRFEQEEVGPVRCLANILGYLVGHYTNFCPRQKTLNEFDKQFEEFRKIELGL